MKNIVFLFCAMMTSAQIAYSEIEVVENGLIYSDDAKKIKTGSEWFAIIEKSKNFSIKKVKIKIEKMKRESDVSPASEISSDSDANFLIRGIALKEGPIKGLSFKEGHTSLIPDEGSIEFEGAKIFSTGEKTIEYGSSVIKNYKVWIQIKGNKILIEQHEYVNVPFSVQWIGDINNDGYPDIRFGSDIFEKSAPDAIYMSEKVKGGAIYKEVGRLQYQSC